MPKISDFPPVLTFKDGHILQLVDTGAAPTVANEKITIQDFMRESNGTALLHGVGTASLTVPITPADLVNWGNGFSSGASTVITDAVTGRFTVTVTGEYFLQHHLLYDAGAQNNDYLTHVGISGTAVEVIATDFVSSGQQSWSAFNGGAYLALTAGQYVTVMVSATTASVGRTIASRWASLSQVT